jgi:predicted nucleic acid-binding protein
MVVSNASPLIRLASIDRLDLLQTPFGEIIIPEAVFREVVVQGRNRSGESAIKAAAWIQVHALSSRKKADTLRRWLDAGEAESIALALERKADWLLIDELRGRRIAGNEGVRYTRVVGVLLLAKKHEVIPAVNRCSTRSRHIISGSALRSISKSSIG